MRRVLWSETAKKDIQNIYDYIAEDSIFYADKFADELIEKADNIALFPNAGRIVPEIGKEEIREVFYQSYRVMYQITDKYISITQVSHMAQNLMIL